MHHLPNVKNVSVFTDLPAALLERATGSPPYPRSASRLL